MRPDLLARSVAIAWQIALTRMLSDRFMFSCDRPPPNDHFAGSLICRSGEEISIFWKGCTLFMRSRLEECQSFLNASLMLIRSRRRTGGDVVPVFD